MQRKSNKKKEKKNTDISRDDKPTIRDVPGETINALGIREKEGRVGEGRAKARVTAIEEARLTSVEKTRGSVFIK